MRAESIRRAELERQRARLDALGPEAREIVDTVTRRTVAKLLHEPTVRIKDAAGSPRGERLAEALRRLFDCRREVPTLRIATRGSPLALRQAGLVAEALASAASSAATPGSRPSSSSSRRPATCTGTVPSVQLAARAPS